MPEPAAAPMRGGIGARARLAATDTTTCAMRAVYAGGGAEPDSGDTAGRARPAAVARPAAAARRATMPVRKRAPAAVLRRRVLRTFASHRFTAIRPRAAVAKISTARTTRPVAQTLA